MSMGLGFRVLLQTEVATNSRLDRAEATSFCPSPASVSPAGSPVNVGREKSPLYPEPESSCWFKRLRFRGFKRLRVQGFKRLRVEELEGLRV